MRTPGAEIGFADDRGRMRLAQVRARFEPRHPLANAPRDLLVDIQRQHPRADGPRHRAGGQLDIEG